MSIETGPKMFDNEHKGFTKFTLDYQGDTSYFSIPNETFEKLKQLAELRNVRIDDLLRAALDKYGFDQAIDEILAEEENKLEPTLPGKEHKGFTKFTLDYQGDTSYFSIPNETFENLNKIAKQHSIKIRDLIRTGIDKYGFDQAIEKIIAEEENI